MSGIICFPAVLGTALQRAPRPRICSRKPLAEWFGAQKTCWQGFPHSRPSPIGLSVPLLLGPHYWDSDIRYAPRPDVSGNGHDRMWNRLVGSVPRTSFDWPVARSALL